MEMFAAFDPNAKGFNRANARALAYLSKLVYEDESTVVDQGGELGFHVDFYQVDETEAALFTRHDLSYSVLAFRGTSSLEDAITDADFLLDKGRFCGRVHSGFKEALEDIWRPDRAPLKLIADYERVIAKPVRLFVTGHSLGAGLATLACADLVSTGIFPTLYTFGSPRVGNARFAKALSRALAGRWYRVENNNDTVTRIPPLFMGYRHGGERVYISSAGRVVLTPTFWFVLFDRIKGRIKDLGKIGTDGAKDHFIDGYLDQLKRGES